MLKTTITLCSKTSLHFTSLLGTLSLKYLHITSFKFLTNCSSVLRTAPMSNTALTPKYLRSVTRIKVPNCHIWKS